MEPGTKKRWLLPAFIVLGLLSLFFIRGRLSSPAAARAQLETAAKDGILVVPIQLERDSYGLAMVDAIGQTLWIYEINNRGPAHSRLRLLAARSWRYDKHLQQYNTAEPKPEKVKIMLENLAQQLQKPKVKTQLQPRENILETGEPR